VGDLRPDTGFGSRVGRFGRVVEHVVHRRAAGQQQLGDPQPAEHVDGVGIQVLLHRQRVAVEIVRSVLQLPAKDRAGDMRVRVYDAGQQDVPGKPPDLVPGDFAGRAHVDDLVSLDRHRAILDHLEFRVHRQHPAGLQHESLRHPESLLL
jgi:hypothetical protein